MSTQSQLNQPQDQNYQPQAADNAYKAPSPKGKYVISNEAQVLLTHLSEESIPCENIAPSLVDNYSDLTSEEQESLEEKYTSALSELMQYGSARIGADGKIYITEAGAKAVDKRIALVYPFGANGTIHSYNKTLDTQTPAAADALFYAQANNLAWLSARSSRATGAILRSLSQAGAFNKLPTMMLGDIAFDSLSAMQDRVDNPLYMIELAEKMTQNYHLLAVQQLKKVVDNLEKWTIKPVTGTNGREITKLYVEDGNFFAVTSEGEIPLEELSLTEIKDIYRQLSS